MVQYVGVLHTDANKVWTIRSTGVIGNDFFSFFLGDCSLLLLMLLVMVLLLL